MSKPELERRIRAGLRLEARADGELPKIVGHAAVFNQRSEDLGWFVEVIAPGAFRAAIPRDDVRALINHDANLVLGRNRAGTLRLSEDEVGLAIEIDPPNTQAARDLVEVLKRGDVSQMSFAFRVRREEWDQTQEPFVRTVLEAELFDVSVVTYPAYPQTDAAVRSLDEWKRQHPPRRPALNVMSRRLALAKRRA